MAFPTIVNTATYTTETDSNTHDITLPSSISSGNLLMVFVSVGGLRSLDSAPAGWNSLYLNKIGSGGGNNNSCLYRTADGSEGSTVTITIASSHKSMISAVSYQFSGASVNGSATAQSVNPPNLNATTPGDIIWIATNSTRRTDNSFGSITNYSNAVEAAQASTFNTGRTRIRCVTRELNASSEDPDEPTTTGTTNSVFSSTVAILGLSSNTGNFLAFM